MINQKGDVIPTTGKSYKAISKSLELHQPTVRYGVCTSMNNGEDLDQ